MSNQSLFDPNREIEPETPASEDKRVGVFVMVVLALLAALLLALVAYYFLVLRPFMVMENHPGPVEVAAVGGHSVVMLPSLGSPNGAT